MFQTTKKEQEDGLFDQDTPIERKRRSKYNENAQALSALIIGFLMLILSFVVIYLSMSTWFGWAAFIILFVLGTLLCVSATRKGGPSPQDHAALEKAYDTRPLQTIPCLEPQDIQQSVTRLGMEPKGNGYFKITDQLFYEDPNRTQFYTKAIRTNSLLHELQEASEYAEMFKDEAKNICMILFFLMRNMDAATLSTLRQFSKNEIMSCNIQTLVGKRNEVTTLIVLVDDDSHTGYYLKSIPNSAGGPTPYDEACDMLNYMLGYNTPPGDGTSEGVIQAEGEPV